MILICSFGKEVMKAKKIFSKKRIKEVAIFIMLMTGLIVLYSALLQKIKFYTSKNEHTAAIDCAPIIDRYGVDEEYYLEFELKAKAPGTVLVYFENGSNARYSFYEYIEAGTEFQRYSMIVKPVLRDESVEESLLGFYGGYGTGVISTVRDITFEVYEE